VADGNSLSAGGTADLTLSVVDQNGSLYAGTAVTITLSSSCIANGLASVAPQSPTVVGQTANSVITTTGTATVTYTARGCGGADAISASAVVNGQSLAASGTITVAQATVGSIQFVTASPLNIGLKGTGLAETSDVTFKVVDQSGNARPGAQVSFALSTSVGGISLASYDPNNLPTSASDGTVHVTVSSGTQHTSVRVIASTASPALSTQSGLLTVTTGLPTADAFDISVGAPTYPPNTTPSPFACPNVEAYNTDGVTVPITARLADRYHNPAPDGTAVAFTTAGGHIAGSCQTPSATGAEDGTCSAIWTSAAPRPLTTGSPPSKRNGRSVILATAIGEESFVDGNGNGYFDNNESFTDLGEPYRDDNENGAYDTGVEYFLDFNNSHQYDGPDGVFNGITCTTGANGTCTTNSLAIGAQNLIIMSTSGANITAPASQSGFTGTTQSGLSIAATSSGTIQFAVADGNGNPMAAGTTIVVTADTAVGSITGSDANYTVGCRSGVATDSNYPEGALGVGLNAASTAGAGTITIAVTSPGTHSVTTASISVTVH
jgi:hypothetical protein